MSNAMKVAFHHIGFDFDDIDTASQRFIECGGTMHHGRDPSGDIVEGMQTR